MSKAIVVIDVGGTTIKYGLVRDRQLTDKASLTTPSTKAAFFDSLSTIYQNYKQDYAISGLAIGFPAVVNQSTGYIEGQSVLPYLHGYSMQAQLDDLFDCPVTITNDATAAAYCELALGAAKGYQEVLFLILGTGVGGVVVHKGEVLEGAHRYAGEFGFYLTSEGLPLYEIGTAIGLAKRYNAQYGTHYSGQEVLELGQAGADTAQVFCAQFYHSLAEAIFSYQQAYDPQLWILGGGVSAAPYLLDNLNQHLQAIQQEMTIATAPIELAVCHYGNDANLLGLALDYERKHHVSYTSQN